MNTLLRYNSDVLMSLCCQHCIATGSMIDARLAMRWFRCSKPTALDILNEYVERGFLDRFTTKHRPNAKKYHYRPKKTVFTAYRNGQYKESFKRWAYGY